MGASALRELEKKMLLHFTDQFWKDHLLAMDRLRHGVSLRGYGQQNPLLEYKREGTEMFMLMCSLRDEAVLTQLLAFTPDMMMPSMNASRQATERILDVAGQAPQQDPNADIPDLPVDLPIARPPVNPQTRLPARGAETRLFAVRNGVDKNAPCPCGTGIKYKKCCRNAEVDPAELALAEEEAAERKAAVAALKAERQAQIDAMREEAAKREAELTAQSESSAQAKDSTEDTFEFTEVDMSWDEVPAGMYGDAEDDNAEDAESDAQPAPDDV